MLNRQKIVLELLKLADHPVGKLELMKWCFLLRQESESGGGPSFYDFLPYHYGPYSFSLQRDLTEFTNQGYIRERGDSWERTGLDLGVGTLSKPLDTDLKRLIRQFHLHTTDSLLDYVYKRYPRFTVNSKRKQLATRPEAVPKVYTAGYEGLQIDAFLDRLISAGIRRLIDVRNNPSARRYGFHKSTLAKLCQLIDVDYTHFPELGVASADRQGLTNLESYSHLFTMYTSVTIPSQSESVDRVASLVKQEPCVLVCMEATPEQCHRSVLAAEVAARTGLPVFDLGCAHETGSRR